MKTDYTVKIKKFENNRLIIFLNKMPFIAIKIFLENNAKISENHLIINREDYQNAKDELLEKNIYIDEGDLFCNESQGVKLFDFQLNDIETMLQKRRIIDASMMGTCKTAKAVVAATRIKSDKKVICCVVPKSLLYNWAIEVERFAPDYKANIITGKNDRIVCDNKIFNIFTYNWLVSHLNEVIMAEPNCLIADECNALKANNNYGEASSQRAKAFMKVASLTSVEYCFLLSGTIITRSVRDIYNLLVIVNARDIILNNFFEFGMRYCGGRKIRTKNRTFYDFNGASCLPELNKKLSRYMIRRSRDEILQNMSFNRQFIPVNVSGITSLDSARSTNEILQLFSIIRQQLSVAKVKYTIDLANNIIENDKVVIATCYKSAIKEIEKYYGDKCVKITGDVSSKKRQEAVAKFCCDDSVRIIAITMQAAGYGLNLQAASSTIIFNDISWSYTDHTQSEARVFRKNGCEFCNFLYLFALNNEVEKHAVKVIRNKFNMANDAIDGGSQQFDITDEMINYIKNLNCKE